MFDNFKNMAGLAGMMKDLPRIKARFEEMKQRLAAMTVDAETGGGVVRATASGDLRIVRIQINQAIMSGLIDAGNPDDKLIAEDLIQGAVNAALAKAREMAEQQMVEAAGELGIPMPPGGLGGLLS